MHDKMVDALLLTAVKLICLHLLIPRDALNESWQIAASCSRKHFDNSLNSLCFELHLEAVEVCPSFRPIFNDCQGTFCPCLLLKNKLKPYQRCFDLHLIILEKVFIKAPIKKAMCQDHIAASVVQISIIDCKRNILHSETET